MNTKEFVGLFRELYRAHGRQFSATAEEKALVYYERLATVDSEALKSAFEYFISDNKLFPTIAGLRAKAMEIVHAANKSGNGKANNKGCQHCCDGRVEFMYFNGCRWETRSMRCAVCYRGETNSMRYMLQRNDTLYWACRETRTGIYVADPSSITLVTNTAITIAYTDARLLERYHRTGDFAPCKEIPQEWYDMKKKLLEKYSK
jgi:hypothetical protein